MVHYFRAEKFTEPYIRFLHSEFGFDGHRFLVAEQPGYSAPSLPGVIPLPQALSPHRKMQIIGEQFNTAQKVIHHGLFDGVVLLWCALHKSALNRHFWVIWGGDLYTHLNPSRGVAGRIVELLRKRAVPNIGNIVTYLEGDYRLAQERLGAQGRYWECLMYLSNTFVAPSAACLPGSPKRILVGNSADRTNEHLEIFDRLADQDIDGYEIVCPLSYGSKSYAADVRRAGEARFGEKFVALNQLMSAEQYLTFLSTVDIAIFAHRRQQAMGNTISLLGLGKKVFLRRGFPQWDLFSGLGIAVFDFCALDLSLLDQGVADKNQDLVADFFSRERLKRQWAAIFSDQSR